LLCFAPRFDEKSIVFISRINSAIPHELRACPAPREAEVVIERQIGGFIPPLPLDYHPALRTALQT
jgi:hypothetical protein